MGNPVRTRKRVYADTIRRGNDGSAFQKWEEFRSTCKKGKQIEIDRNGFETWRKMSNKERKPYAIKAEEVNSAYVERLFQEIDYSSEVDDDEADSAIVGKFDPDCLSLHFRYDTFREFESLNTWDMLQPWI
ncbi:uncharacterized protein LOC126661066 isoform X2 [Mercurialis annua]|uniref:uncharacterized protein LOC126661066 isoform X2 n=1 Tax=Mercurialis annua TaxID=3986 RepID=UPI00215F61EC|nr:uncharacterized protein LOC126661066 isoform X2 [Mercurialis annua]